MICICSIIECATNGSNFLPPILRIEMNQLNYLDGDEPTDKSREWNPPPP